MGYPTQRREREEDLVKVADDGVVSVVFWQALFHGCATHGACQEGERDAPEEGEEEVGYYDQCWWEGAAAEEEEV